jgi:hypothetical protein
LITEPPSLIAIDDPVSCAIYARDNNLLHLPSWKPFKAIAKREKKLIRMVYQAKIKLYNSTPRCKYGYEIPRNFDHAMMLDAKNQNTQWKDVVDLELSQINEYHTFLDKPHHSKPVAPTGYKNIRVHPVFDVKHDGRHKASLVADGHLTEVTLDSVYSGVVSI